MTIKERIEKFISYKGIRRSVFEKTCGLSNGYTRNLKESPSVSKIEDILTAYPELNRVWLLSGEGEMLLSEKIHPQDSSAKTIELLEKINELNTKIIMLMEEIKEKDSEIDELRRNMRSAHADASDSDVAAAG